MPIAELYDGTRLEFPEGTDPAVIQKTVKDQTWLRQEIEERGKTDWARAGAQMLGGALGGVSGAVSPVPGGAYIGAGMGDAMGGLAYDSYKRHILGKDQYKTPTDYATGAVVDTTVGVVAPKVFESAAPYVSGAIRGVLQPVKSSVVRKAAKGTSGDAIENLNLFQRHGFRPDVGMVTNNPSTQTLAQSIRKTPGGGAIMARNDLYNYGKGQELLDSVTAKIGTARSRSDLGQAVKSAAARSKSSLLEKAEGLYGRAEQLIPDNMMVSAPNTRAVVAEIENELSDPATAPMVRGVNSIMGGIKKSMSPSGELNARTMKNLKSLLGSVYKKPNADIVDGKYKMLFRALREDLDNVTSAVGPEAAEALNEANAFYRAFKGNPKAGQIGQEAVLNEIIEQANSGDIYRTMMSKASGDADKLKRAFNLLPENINNDVRATVLQQMGMANPGVQNAAGDAFSFNTFLTNVNKLSPEAKNILFRGKADVAKDFDDLLKVSEFIKSLERSANHSNTDNIRMWREIFKPIEQGVLLGGTGGSFGGASGILKGAAVGAGVQGARVGYQYRMAKLLTNPDFVRWLAQGGKQALKPAQKGTNLYTHLAKLPVIAKANPEIKGEIDAYLNQFDAPIKRQ